MLKIKHGADVHGLRTEIVIALFIAERIYNEHGYLCTITEGSGGKHGYSSEHRKGDAVDLRTRHINKQKQKLLTAEIEDALGRDYDVVLEETHLHLEYDPK